MSPSSHRWVALALYVLAAVTGPPVPPAAAASEPHVPGSGSKLYSGDDGSISLRLLSTFRYLNQTAIDDTTVDSFGATRFHDPRQDMQLNKVTIYTFGWLLDPRFRYLAYVWTSNVSQGQDAQVVVAGNLQYRFSDLFDVGVGVGGLPGTRSTVGQWPNWLASDSRLIADEFFRPSYTTGAWSKGKIATGLGYELMLGNNLSQLGIDANQLDNSLSTLSGTVSWMPTTGEFGPGAGYGDFERHEALASRLSLHYTRSDENRQGQPSTEAPENAQIRLSDGNVVFQPNLFGDGITVTDVRYRMTSMSAGLKLRGFSLEGDWFIRQVDDIRGFGVDALGFEQLDDHGGQIEASAMLADRSLQAYGGASMIQGQYGDPWQTRLGLNYFPARNKSLRVNAEWIRVEGSPVGALSLPLTVGATGSIFAGNIELNW